MLMGAVDSRVHAHCPLDLASGVRISEDLRVDPVPGAVSAEPAMTLPRRLPRPGGDPETGARPYERRPASTVRSEPKQHLTEYEYATRIKPAVDQPRRLGDTP